MIKIWNKIRNAISSRSLPRSYLKRKSHEEFWKQQYLERFPVVDKILSVFCDAFMFDRTERFKFLPDDKMMDIYKSVYPSKWMPDCLEFDFLIRDLEQAFGFEFDPTKFEQIDSFKALIEEILKVQP